MTEKTIVECDGPDRKDCAETARTEAGFPSGWSTLELLDGSDRHFCDACTEQAQGLLTDGVSVGPLLNLQHSHRGHNFERANIDAGTHDIVVEQVIDEPTRRFPDYNHDDEAWHIGVFDHLHVYVFGAHKNEPLVVVDSDEFPTQVAVTDLEDSFTVRDDPEFTIRSREQLREARNE